MDIIVVVLTTTIRGGVGPHASARPAGRSWDRIRSTPPWPPPSPRRRTPPPWAAAGRDRAPGRASPRPRGPARTATPAPPGSRAAAAASAVVGTVPAAYGRSEERRVGKE